MKLYRNKNPHYATYKPSFTIDCNIFSIFEPINLRRRVAFSLALEPRCSSVWINLA